MSYFNPKQVDWKNRPHWAEAVATLNSAPYAQIFWIGSNLYSEFMCPDGKTLEQGRNYNENTGTLRSRSNFKILEKLESSATTKKDVKSFIDLSYIPIGTEGEIPMPEVKQKSKYSPYHRLIQSQHNPIYDADGKFIGLMVDAYDVFEAFDPQDRTEPETHALKKLLIPGKRGAKEIIQDIKEAIWSLNLSLVKRVHREAKNKYFKK
jgi:hypothetical protein